MEILTSVKRLYISFKSLVNDFVYSFDRAALLLLVEVQNHTVPVRERGRIRVKAATPAQPSGCFSSPSNPAPLDAIPVYRHEYSYFPIRNQTYGWFQPPHNDVTTTRRSATAVRLVFHIPSCSIPDFNTKLYVFSYGGAPEGSDLACFQPSDMTCVEVSGFPPWCTWRLASIRTFARISHAPAHQPTTKKITIKRKKLICGLS